MSRSLFRFGSTKMKTRLAQALRRSGGFGVGQDTAEQGVTLLECLVAISVIAITGAMITPPLFLAAATRVQNQRSEQAQQIAQAEIDRIRVLVEQGRHRRIDIPFPIGSNNIANFAAPSAIAGRLKSASLCMGVIRHDDSRIPAEQVLPIDVNGDCEADFLMQSFRTNGTFAPGEVSRPTEFTMGVRVYANSARNNLGGLSVQPASLNFTSGEGNQRQRPLAVIYSRMTWSDTDFSLCNYHGTCE